MTLTQRRARRLLTDAQLIERDAKIARLIALGVCQSLVAERFGVARCVVSQSLKRHRLRQQLAEFDGLTA